MIEIPVFLDYGLSSQNVYVDVEMTPLCPRSNTYLESFSLEATSFEGLRFDNATGCISGKPTMPSSFKSTTIKVAGSNSLGSVSTQITLYFSSIPESFNQGAEVCYIPISSPIPDLYPSQFAYANLTCFKQSSFSWADSFDKAKQAHSNPSLSSLPTHAALRIESYFFTPFSTPTTFSLSSTSAVLFYLDHYTHPLLEAISVDSPIERSVTIMLKSGFHRIVAYSTTFSTLNSYSYFSFFFSYHCYETDLKLLATRTLLYPRSSPRDAYFPYTVGFESIPFVIDVVSPAVLTQLDVIHFPDSLRITSSSQLKDVLPTVGEFDYGIRFHNGHGDRYYQGSYRVEGKREGVLVSVSEVMDRTYETLRRTQEIGLLNREVVYQHQVKSFESFTAR